MARKGRLPELLFLLGLALQLRDGFLLHPTTPPSHPSLHHTQLLKRYLYDNQRVKSYFMINATTNVVETPASSSVQPLQEYDELELLESLDQLGQHPHTSSSTLDLFCNREVNMREISAVGFDMDHTLAQYKPAFDFLTHQEATKHLVHWLHYPPEVLDIAHEPDLCRRCCVVDPVRGNVYKLDAHRYVHIAYHGVQELSKEQRRLLSAQILTETSLVSLDTPFSLVDACLFVKLVQYKDSLNKQKVLTEREEKLQKKSYQEVWADLRKAVDRSHKDGGIKDKVKENPGEYIIYDPDLFDMLSNFRSAGKKTFLLTNSLFDYTAVVMDYLLNAQRKRPRRYGVNLKWMDYFDVVIVGGNKPNFLSSDSLPLYEVNPFSGSLKNVEDSPSLQLQYGGKKVFQGGHAQLLHTMLQTSGDSVLYVGDHLFADVLKTKRAVGWRTCLVSPELSPDLLRYSQYSPLRKRIGEMRREQVALEERLDKIELKIYRVREKLLQESDTEGEGGKEEEESKLPASISSPLLSDLLSLEEQSIMYQRQLSLLKSELSSLHLSYDRLFHPQWGQLFRAGFQESRLGRQVRDYACLVTSKASNLGRVNPNRPFRPSQDLMPHDLFTDNM